MRRRLGEDLGVGPDADLEVLRPHLLREQQFLELHRLRRAGLDLRRGRRRPPPPPGAHRLRRRRVAARLLLDHALEHARGEGHAGGLDRLQVAGREQVQVLRIGLVGERVVEVADRLARRRADGRQRVGQFEQRADRGRDAREVEQLALAQQHRRRPAGRAWQPGAADQRGAFCVRGQGGLGIGARIHRCLAACLVRVVCHPRCHPRAACAGTRLCDRLPRALRWLCNASGL